jgi:hypothetical protein
MITHIKRKSSEINGRKIFSKISNRKRKIKPAKLFPTIALGILIILVLVISIDGINIPSASSAEPTIVIKRAFFETDNHADSVVVEKSDMYLCHNQVSFKIPSIESIKPSQVTLVYRNVRAVNSYDSEFQSFLNNNWILRDAQGNLIHTTANPYQYIVDKGSSTYQQWVANWINSYVYQYGYDGVFLDCSVYPTVGENLWGTPAYDAGAINPRTGRLYTNQEHKQAEISLINKIKSTLGTKLVIGNGIYEGQRFFQRDYDEIILNSQIDGVVSEGWLMTFDNPYWYSESKWLENIKFAAWLETNFLSRGKIFIPTMQNVEPYDGGSTRLPSGTTAEQYALYGFSSLLLTATKSGSTYINFGKYMLRDYPQSLFKIELGMPLGSYYMITETHVYARDYTKTKIFVNPTYNTYTVHLDGTYRTYEGQTVSSSITMYPHTGRILERLSDAPAAGSEEPQSSSLLFSDSFESNNFGKWNKLITTSGEIAYISRASWGAPVFEGEYSARFRTDGQYAIARAYAYKQVESKTTLYVQATINYDSGLSLNKWKALWTIQFVDSSNSVIASYGVKADQTSTKWACMYGSQTNFASFGPQPDKWYIVEAMFKKSSYGDTLALYVNGAQVASLSINTSGENSITGVRIGIAYNDAGYTSAIYADTIKIYDNYI